MYDFSVVDDFLRIHKAAGYTERDLRRVIERPEILMKFKGLLDGHLGTVSALPVMMRIRIEAGVKDFKHYLTVLEDERWLATKSARQLLLQTPPKEVKRVSQVDFVRVSTGQLLGNKGRGTLREIFAAAKIFGLTKCHWCDGPEIRTMYMNQPDGERLRIASDPLVSNGGEKKVFLLDNQYGRLRLETFKVGGGIQFHGESLWVFRLKRRRAKFA